MRRDLVAGDEVALAAAAVASSLLAAFVLVEMGPELAFAFALLPVIAVGVVYVLVSGQILLFAAAVVFPMSAVPMLGLPLIGPLYAADLVAGLALGSVILARFLVPGKLPPVPHTPVLGLPFVLFGAAVLMAMLRGQHAYGASFFGQPLRLAFYAAMVGAFIGITVPRMYVVLQTLFYGVALYGVVLTFYVLGAGGSVSGQDNLSTGGTRVLSISASVYCAGALLLALLSLRFGLGSRWLHIGIAPIALFGVVLGFGRAVYASVAIVVLLLLATSARLRGAVVSVVPLAMPFLALLGVGIALAAPQLVETTSDRLFSPPESDANVRWRLQANATVLEQVREQPIVGVGFGRPPSSFFIERPNPSSGLPEFHRVEISQDPHNGYMYFLAGGGIVLLATFAFVLVTFVRDAIGRYRSNHDPHSRLIVVWAGALLFVFLVNAASTTTFSVPESIMMIWALLVMPAIVAPGSADDSEAESDAGARAISAR